MISKYLLPLVAMIFIAIVILLGKSPPNILIGCISILGVLGICYNVPINAKIKGFGCINIHTETKEKN